MHPGPALVMIGQCFVTVALVLERRSNRPALSVLVCRGAHRDGPEQKDHHHSHEVDEVADRFQGANLIRTFPFRARKCALCMATIKGAQFDRCWTLDH